MMATEKCVPHTFSFYLFSKVVAYYCTAVMARERDVQKPIVKTYLSLRRFPTGNVVHARIYAPSFNLDRKGSGTNIENAIADAVAGLSKAKPRVARKQNSQ